MTRLWSPSALLPAGWASDVRLTLDAGLIATVIGFLVSPEAGFITECRFGAGLPLVRTE